jgi:hypothetical protein
VNLIHCEEIVVRFCVLREGATSSDVYSLESMRNFFFTRYAQPPDSNALRSERVDAWLGTGCVVCTTLDDVARNCFIGQESSRVLPYQNLL